MLVTLPHLPYQHWFSEVITYASTSQDFLLRMFLLLSCFPTRCLPVGSQDVNVCWYLPVHDALVVRQDIPLSGMSGETNSSTSSISKTKSKCCTLQNMTYMSLMFCSTLKYHPLVYSRVVLSLMTLLDEVMLLHIRTHPLSEFRTCECWVCVSMWLSEILSNFHCFRI
jgi:hypothetical protein